MFNYHNIFQEAKPGAAFGGDPDITYIAGPMTGYPEFNYPAFAAAAEELRAQGRTVISPAELHPADPSVAWDWYLRRDLAELVKCSHIYLLNGWQNSKGANLEYSVALTLGMTIHHQPVEVSQ